MTPKKRIILIILLLAVAGLIAYALYYFFFKAAPAAIVTPPPATPALGGKLPPAGERVPGTGVTPGQPAGALVPAGVISGQPAPTIYRPEPVTQINTDNALYPSLNNDILRYHNANDGKFYKVTADGTIKQMSDHVFYGVTGVTWAKNNDKAILEYPDNSKIVYNFEQQKQIASLPKHWQEFSWSNDGYQIAAKSIGLSPENRWLVVTKDDGTETKLVEPMGENADKVTINWSPSRQTVAFSQTGEPLGVDRSEILFIGLNNENFKSTIVEGRDFVPRWSPSGQRLLYSVDSGRSNFNPELWIVDSYGDNIGNNRKNLQINTWANKCAFAGEATLYCAVPRDLPAGSGMNPELAAGVYDNLYKIDLTTGYKTPINLGTNYTINNISYNATEKKLFFTDASQSGVFEVNL